MSLLLFDSFDTDALTAFPAAAYSRMMAALLPPGKVWRLVASMLSGLFDGCADELGRLSSRATDLLRESIASTAVELLPEYETELDLASTGSNSERQARIVSRLVARQRYRPSDFQNALAPLLAQAPAAVDVIERSHAFADALGDDREIFRFYVYRDPTLPGAYFIDAAQTLIDQIKPSHTIGKAIESTAAVYESAHSLYDRDLMGA